MPPKNLPDHCSRPLAEHARKDWDRIFKPRGPMLGGENYYKDDEQDVNQCSTPKKAK
jgi:hypothetical protein